MNIPTLSPRGTALLAGAALALPMVCAGAQAQSSIGEAGLRQFTAAAGPLGRTLLSAADTYKVNVIAADDLLAGKSAPSISGRMSAENALARALAGSGLVARRTGDGVFVITRRQSASRSAGRRLAARTATENIVVTAQRVEQAEQDVPISLEVISAEYIEERPVDFLSDVLHLAPNVSVQAVGSNYLNNIIVRGVGNEIAFTDPGVSVFMNGAPMPSGLSDFGLLNVERVEVLRGPQSTLFGQNSAASAINVVTAAPLRQGWRATGIATLGNFGQQSFSAGLETAIVPGSAGLRLGARLADSDGYLRNLRSGRRIGGQDDYDITAEFDASPGERWNVSLRLWDARHVSAMADTARPGTYEIDAPADPREKRRASGAIGVARWYGQRVQVESQTGWRKLDLDFDSFATYPNAAAPFDLFNDVLTYEEYLFQELRLIRAKNDGRLGWQLGAYVADESLRVDQSVVSDFDFGVARLLNTQTFLHRQDTRRYEAFAQLDYEFTDDLTLTLGGRYSRVDRDADQRYLLASPLAQQDFATALQRDYSNSVGRVALTYAVSASSSAYASFSQGFKPGTARSGATNSDELFLPSEALNNYEVGLKSRFDNASIDLAVFLMDYENRHTFFNNGTIPTTVAVPQAEVSGAELSVNYAFSDALSVFGRGAYLDTGFDEFSVNVFGTPFDIGGNEFMAAPHWTAAAGVRFETALGGAWRLFANTDVSYQSDSFGNVSNTAQSRNDEYALVNASAGISNGRLTFQLALDNLFDEHYFLSTYQADGRGHPGPPRTITGRIRIEFGR